MSPPRRRISYVISPSADPVQRLKLPPIGVSRHGSPQPLIIPSQLPPECPDDQSVHDPHPRHRLGVMALALDSTTQLEQRAAPEGILYTGSRDGQVISWDLGLPYRKRHAQPHGHPNRWERLTSMIDETWDDDAEEEEEERRDGDVLGDVKESGARRWKDRRNKGGEMPYEHQWELDMDAHEFPSRPQFRQCVQLHTDWINDILLCNYNQLVISASSDGTVKSWSPHADTFTEPSTIGFHADYVRCLALSRERNWVASGSFDRTIKLWDLTRTSSAPEPLLTLNPPDPAVSKASVYSLAVDPYGHIVASGSPERVVRMWDSRSGKRVGKLVGHTENIRAILISEDARYLLTGSADASIKLWSLASQRCLYTFTYHTDSVWALHSSHPSLEVFYSGDKSGIVCKVDVEDCGDVTDGACIVLSRDPCGETGDGVNKIVAADDGLLWTACGSSTVSRWKLPNRVHEHSVEDSGNLAPDSSATTKRRKRVSLGTDSAWLPSSPSRHHGRRDKVSSYPGVPWGALVQLTSPNGPYTPSSFVTKARDAEVATLYSAASIVSVPGGPSVFGTALQQSSAAIPPSSTLRSMKSLASISNADHDLSHDNRLLHEIPELAPDAEPYNAAPDSVILGSHGLVRAILLNDRMHALTVDTKGEVAVWDIVRGICCGKYTKEDVRAASRCGSAKGSARSKGSESAFGEKDKSPREALEVVRERIEGEAVISSWSSVDTKAGVLTVHLNERCFDAEIYADEAGFEPKHLGDEQRINIGKWVLRNLFLGFIREEQRIRRRREGSVSDSNLITHTNLHRDLAPTHMDIHHDASSSTGRRSTSEVSSRSSTRTAISTVVFTSPHATPAILPSVPAATKVLPLLPPMIPLATSNTGQSQVPITRTHASSNDRTPMPIRTHGLDAPPPYTASHDSDYFTFRSQQPSAANVAVAGGELPGSNDPSSPTKVGADSPTSATPGTPSTGGFMGLFKNFGKAPGRRSVAEATPGSPVAGGAGSMKDVPTLPEEHETKMTRTPAQILLSNPISPPSSSEAPTLALPPSITVMICDEYYPGWRTIYRSSVSNMSDTYVLEEALPLWLLEYLLMNRAPPPPNIKLSFVLLPWPNPEPGGVQLPELLNTAHSKLTASRFLRVRKLTHHVQEKLEKLSGPPGSPAMSFSHLELTAPNRQHRARAEEVYEILCNDSVLPLNMTLGAVRHYFWRHSSELVMHYRLCRRQSVYCDTSTSVDQ
ncbi:hypothetical protein BKA82DRAFT_122050 [Pisolithus tinctorius]|uniref:Uncharacterized protein n=1 Tax=Pisolithus tinctorius Marx 270 TaxID=870435 RepID=A0A0C3PVT9_PISTI|nr:hypothetical protein BKA82DRAFT_122050 [Pisolithus tinctorius]KIO13396.1 hypothetical protein M404DRAFT_122050 [Pisolithus tinctorius Marx 270]